MKLQELIKKHDLDLTPDLIKAFFLGALNAEKPMPFNKVLGELFSEEAEAKADMESELKNFWDDLAAKKLIETKNLFAITGSTQDFLNKSRDQLDYFLTTLSLSGTNMETCKDEDLVELIDELEDCVMDLDEYLSEEAPDAAEGEELKVLLLETWEDFLETKQF
jgi:hypothetical protein